LHLPHSLDLPLHSHSLLLLHHHHHLLLPPLSLFFRIHFHCSPSLHLARIAREVSTAAPVAPSRAPSSRVASCSGMKRQRGSEFCSFLCIRRPVRENRDMSYYSLACACCFPSLS
ncbi:hypothetical protein V8G54_031073, partial [Vigna mungo]